MTANHTDSELSAIEFCESFRIEKKDRRYILGRNVYSQSVISQFELAGVVDDFTAETAFEGVPIVRSVALPKDALVLNASGGRTLTAKAQLDRLGVRNLDYFAFYRFSPTPLRDIVFNEGFNSDYEGNRGEYLWIADRFADRESRDIFNKIVGFRRSLDIGYLEGFSDNESGQYFEDFLNLKEADEVFVDVGCFNGFNSLEFARRSPRYRSIHAFEPDPANFEVCARNLRELRDVHLRNIGLSDEQAKLKLSPGGSGSKISDQGTVEILVDSLDHALGDAPTLIKMDIEGAEYQALGGAEKTILHNHPRLAICVYHNVGDFHRIPRLVLGIRDDYDVYLRHYTETIYETVMFFIPRTP